MEDRMGGHDGVFSFAGFREDSTCVARATPAKQVAPQLAAGCFTVFMAYVILSIGIP